jgi:hypothetical protein
VLGFIGDILYGIALLNEWAFEGEKIIRGIANVTAQSVDMGTAYFHLLLLLKAAELVV